CAASAWEGFDAMDKRQCLREIVARLGRVREDEVGPGFPLGPLVSRSISAHLLDTALRKQLGVGPLALQSLGTYAELEVMVLGGGEAGGRPPRRLPATTDGGRPSPLPPPEDGPGGLACGLDVESVSSLPVTDDHWSHEFYSASFTSTEIAYCVAQAHPRRHF